MQGKVLADRLCKMGCLNQGITFDDYSTPFAFKIYNLNYCDYIIKKAVILLKKFPIT